MANAGVKVTAYSSEYQREMRAAVESTKLLASQFTVAATQAKIFGDSTQSLEAKQQALTAKLSAQSKVTEIHTNEVKHLTEQLAKQKSEHEELKGKIEKVTTAYEKQAKTTGEDSAEAKALKTELEKLKKEQSDTETAIGRTEKALTKTTTEQNKSKVATMEMGAELKKLNQQLKDQALDKFAEGLDKIGKKAEAVGKELTKVATVPIVGAMVASGKAAIDFESAFTGVKKTVDEVVDANGNVTYSYEQLKQGIVDMSNEIPASTTAISEVAEAAGQLGIETDNVLSFTRVMIDLGNSTNLAATDAASSLAKFANITQMSQADFDRLGSVIVALGNNYATTEADIVSMATNLASAGSQIGLSEADIMGLSTALSSVGMEAQAGGTAFSKVMIEMQLATETGGDKLQDFAKVAGMSADEFAQKFKAEPVAALSEFITGLSDTDRMGQSTIAMLDEMGVTETRLRDSLLRAASASDLFTGAIETGRTAWKENTALTTEAEQRYGTTASQIEMTKNKIVNLGADIGAQLLPHFTNMLDKVSAGVEYFQSLSSETKGTILQVAGIVAAVGPATLVLGKMATGISAGVKAFQALRTSASLLNIVLAANPIGIIVIAIAALVAGFVIAYNHCEGFRNIVNAVGEAIKTAFFAVVDFFASLPEKIGSTVNAVADFFTTLPEKIGGAVNKVIETVKTWATNLFNTVKTETPKIIESIIDFFKSLPERIGFVIGFAIGTLIKWAVELVNAARTEIPKIVEAVINFMKELPSKIWNAIITAKDKIIEWGKLIYDNATSKIKETVESVRKFMSELPSKLVDAIKSAPDKIVEWGKNLVEKGKQAATDLKDAVVKGAQEIPQKMLEIGKNIVEGVWNGINNAKNWFKDQINGFFKGIVDGAKSALGIASPSKVMAEIGKHTVEGFEVGINNKKSDALNTMDKFANSAIDKLKDVLGITSSKSSVFKKFGVNTVEGFLDGLKSMSESVQKVIGKTFDMSSVFKEIESRISSYKNMATDMFSQINTESDASVKDMIGNLKHNQKAIADWSKNIADLAKRGLDDGLLDELRKAGPQSAGTVAELVKASDKELKELNTSFGKGGEVATKALATSLGLGAPLLAEQGKSAIDSIAGAMSKNMSMNDAMATLINGAKLKATQSVASADFNAIGGLVMDGQMKGLTDNEGKPISAIENIGKKVLDATKSVFGIASPSKVFAEYGGYLMEGLAQGINENSDIVSNAVVSVSDEQNMIVSEKFEGIKQTMSTIMQAAKDVIQQKLDNIKTAYDQNGGGIKGIVAATMTTIHDTWSSKISAIDNLTGGKLTEIKNSFSNKLNEAHSIASGVLDNIKNAFTSKMDAARDAVFNAIEKIKSFFKFEWSLPQIKLPHFSIEGKFSLNPPKVPSFNVEWYKSGGIMTQPTIFGMNGTRVLAGGEAGAEAILPLAPFYAQLAKMLDDKMRTYQQQTQINVEAHCYIDGDEVASKTYQRTSDKFATDYKKRR